MIVDTSALVAIAANEAHADILATAIMTEGGLVAAPAFSEYHRVITRRGSIANPDAVAALQYLLENGLQHEPFTQRDAEMTTLANQRFGRGNGRGGTLNLLDLMVYGMAKRMGLPILCTGRDFAATDIDIHPASRSR